MILCETPGVEIKDNTYKELPEYISHFFKEQLPFSLDKIKIPIILNVALCNIKAKKPPLENFNFTKQTKAMIGIITFDQNQKQIFSLKAQKSLQQDLSRISMIENLAISFLFKNLFLMVNENPIKTLTKTDTNYLKGSIKPLIGFKLENEKLLGACGFSKRFKEKPPMVLSIQEREVEKKSSHFMVLGALKHKYFHFIFYSELFKRIKSFVFPEVNSLSKKQKKNLFLWAVESFGQVSQFKIIHWQNNPDHPLTYRYLFHVNIGKFIQKIQTLILKEKIFKIIKFLKVLFKIFNFSFDFFWDSQKKTYNFQISISFFNIKIGYNFKYLNNERKKPGKWVFILKNKCDALEILQDSIT